MAARVGPSPVHSLPSPSVPSSPLRQSTPSAYKVKTQFLFRHAQDSTKGTQDHPSSHKFTQDHPNSPKLTQDNTHSPKLTQDHTHSPKLTQDHTHSPKLTQDHPSSPTFFQDHSYSPTFTQDHTHSPKFTQDHPFSPKFIPSQPELRNHPYSPKLTQDHPISPKFTQDHPISPKLTQDYPFSPKFPPKPKSRRHPKSPKVTQDHPLSPKFSLSHLESTLKNQNHLHSPKLTQDHPLSPKFTQDHALSPKLTQSHLQLTIVDPTSPKFTRDHPHSPRFTPTALRHSHPNSPRFNHNQVSPKFAQDHLKFTYSQPRSEAGKHTQHYPTIFTQIPHVIQPQKLQQYLPPLPSPTAAYLASPPPSPAPSPLYNRLTEDSFTPPSPIAPNPASPYTHGLDLRVRGGPGSEYVPQSFPLSALSLPGRHHHHHHKPHHHHHRYHPHSRPRPRTSGEGPIMLTEDSIRRENVKDPTACLKHKSFHLEATSQDSNGHRNKPILQWNYEDVVSFVLEGRTRDADFNFNLLSGMKGPDLLNSTKEFFVKFSAHYGEELYEQVQRRNIQDQVHNLHPLYQTTTATTTTTNNPTTTSTTPTTSSSPHYNPPQHFPYAFTADHSTPQPSVCDAQAPYELRIETQPHQSQPNRYNRDLNRYTLPTIPNSPSLKTAPPPLMTMEGEERGGRSGEGAAGGEGQRTEEVKVEPPKKRGPGRPKKPESELKKKKKKTGRLWEFIRNLLLNPETCPSLVRWENAEEGLFRFVDGEKVAKRWGDRKNNKEMNYEKLSRAMRYYYKTHIFEAVIGRRLVYKFGKKATNWRPTNPNFTNLHPANTTPPTTSQEPITPFPVHHIELQTPAPHSTPYIPQLLRPNISPPPQPASPTSHTLAHHIQGLSTQPHHST